MCRVALCCICKNENLYMDEFIQYYKKLGFDTIYIFDNNDINGEDVTDITNNYRGVEVINVRGWRLIQNQSYQYCYDMYGDLYDWMAFVDLDEFIVLEKHKDIRDFLNEDKFKDFDMVHLNWMIMTDNDQTYYTSEPQMKRFTKPKDLYFKRQYNFPENAHIKSIVRCGLGKLVWSTPHTPSTMGLRKGYGGNKQIRCANAKGELINGNEPFLMPMDFSIAYIKHFWSRSTQEYIEKTKRGYPLLAYAMNQMKLDKQQYFIVNEWTPEKEKLFNENGM